MKQEFPKMIYKNGVPKHGEAEKLERNVDWVIVHSQEQLDACLKEWGQSPKKVEKKVKKEDNIVKVEEKDAEKAVKPRRKRVSKLGVD